MGGYVLIGYVLQSVLGFWVSFNLLINGQKTNLNAELNLQLLRRVILLGTGDKWESF